MTGEIRRSFLKHKVYGTVFCVDVDETGEVLAALAVSEASTCIHTKDDLTLNLDDAKAINEHFRDYEAADLKCTDPTHLLADIGQQEKVCAEAEAAWKTAHSEAKSLKEAFDAHQNVLRRMVRDATSPKPLPLLDSVA